MASVTLVQGAMLAFSAVAAGAAIQPGRAASQAADFEAKSAEQQAEQARIKALDDELQRRRMLADSLAAGSAMGAQSGFDPFGMGSSFLALREEVQREADRDTQMIRLLGANQVGALNAQAKQSRIAGSAAMTSGYLKATGVALEGASNYMSTTTPKTTTASPKMTLV